jgi:ribosomal protein L11
MDNLNNITKQDSQRTVTTDLTAVQSENKSIKEELTQERNKAESILKEIKNKSAERSEREKWTDTGKLDIKKVNDVAILAKSDLANFTVPTYNRTNYGSLQTEVYTDMLHKYTLSYNTLKPIPMPVYPLCNSSVYEWTDIGGNNFVSYRTNLATIRTTETKNYGYTATPTVEAFRGAFDGSEISSQIMSALRTNVTNWDSDTLVNFARAYSGRNYKVAANMMLPLLKFYLYSDSLIGDAPIINITNLVHGFNVTPIYRQAQAVTPWPWSPDTGNAPNLYAAKCSLNYFSRMLTGAVTPPNGWDLNTPFAIIPIKSAWASDGNINTWWTLGYTQYPWSLIQHTTQLTTWVGDGIDNNAPVTYMRNSNCVYIPGERRQVLYVVVDLTRNVSDCDIRIGGVALDDTNDLENNNFVQINILNAFAAIEMAPASLDTCVNRWHEIYRCADSELDALYAYSVLCSRFSEPSNVDGGGTFDNAHYVNIPNWTQTDIVGVNGVGFGYAIFHAPNAQNKFVDMVFVDSTMCYPAVADGADIGGGIRYTHEISSYDQVQGIMIASQYWKPDHTNVLQPNLQARVAIGFQISAKIACWHDLILEIMGLPQIYGLVDFASARNIPFQLRKLAKMLYQDYTSLWPTYTTNATLANWGFGSNAMGLNNHNYTYCTRKTPICFSRSVIGQVIETSHSSKQYGINYEVRSALIGGANRAAIIHRDNNRTSDELTMDRNLNSGYRQTNLFTVDYSFNTIWSVRRLVLSRTAMFQVDLILTGDGNATYRNIGDGNIPFLPIVGVVPRMSFGVGVVNVKMYQGCALANVSTISKGRTGSLAPGFDVSDKYQYLANTDNITDDVVDDATIFDFDF